MLIRRLIPLACVLVLGCDPNAEPVGEGPASASDSGSATTDGTTSGGSTTGMPTTAGSISGSGSSSSASDSMTSIGSSGEPDDTEGPLLDVGDGDTTGVIAGECDLEAIVCDVVENGKVLPEDVVDCGSVSLDDTPDDYAAMQACILEASGNQAAYKGFVQLQGIDSEVWVAYGSLVGFAYGEHRWTYDNYQGAETIWMSTCEPLPSTNPGCQPGPEVGLCLDCNSEEPPVVCSSE